MFKEYHAWLDRVMNRFSSLFLLKLVSWTEIQVPICEALEVARLIQKPGHYADTAKITHSNESYLAR